MRFAARLLGFGFLTLALSDAHAGTIRYQLSDFLGEYRFEGFEDFNEPNAHEKFTTVSLPERYLSASVRLVVSGTISLGKAQGDGILRDSGEFDYEGAIRARFEHPFWGGSIPLDPKASSSILQYNEQDGQFYMELAHADPFSLPPPYWMPATDHLPRVENTLLLSLNLVPAINAGPPLLVSALEHGIGWDDGLAVTLPITATVSEAYLEVSGNAIVPEPGTDALTLLGFATIVMARVSRCAICRPESAAAA